MRLIGKYDEYSINDITLYAASEFVLPGIMDKPGAIVTIKEYIPKNYKRINAKGEPVIIAKDKRKRHQVLIQHNLGFAKVSVYSTPFSTKEIENLKLKPIESVTKKERAVDAIYKLSGGMHSKGFQRTWYTGKTGSTP